MFPDHLLTLQEWDALPQQGYRWAELAEGVLEMAPGPSVGHQFALSRVRTQIGTAAHAAGYSVLPEVAVVTDSTVPAAVGQPDMCIVGTTRAASATGLLSAADVVVAVEITTVGTRRRDRMTKRSQEETARICRYGLIDMAGPCVAVEAVDPADGRYQFSDRVRGGFFALSDPFSGRVDVDALRPGGGPSFFADG